MGELLFARIARDESKEMGGAAVGFRAEDSSETLGLLLARTERAGNLDEDVRVRQVDSEVPYLREHDRPQFIAAEALVDPFAFRLGSFSGDERCADLVGNGFHLREVLPDYQD